MLQVAICDDENAIVNQIEDIILKLCEREGIKVEIDVFYGGNAIVKQISSGNRYDLIYFDIQMENGDGIYAANFIRRADENAVFIFISGYDKYMIELFGLDVFSFVRKPIDVKNLQKIFMQAYQKICNKNYYFSFHYKNKEYKILFKDIYFFESRGRQIIVHNKNEKICFNDKLSNVEKKLDFGVNPFLRIHQSYLVNYHCIKMRTKKEIELLNGMILPISEDRQKTFGLAYSELIRGEMNV